MTSVRGGCGDTHGGRVLRLGGLASGPVPHGPIGSARSLHPRAMLMAENGTVNALEVVRPALDKV